MKMRSIYLAVLGATVTAAAHAGNCSAVDIPVSFTISSSYTDPFSSVSYTSGILPDGLGAYVNGQPGVTALIHVCNGSNAATLNTGSGPRFVTWNFQNVVDTNGLTPGWTQSPVNNNGFTIANLLYNYNPSGTYSFQTYLQFAYFQSITYGFDMQDPLAHAPFNPPDANVNAPCDTSLVNVTHYPATTSSKETWIVWPDSSPVYCSGTVSGSHAQVGTLLVKARPNWVSGGQFTVPFYITIQRK